MKVLSYIYNNFSKILPLLTFYVIIVGYLDLKTQFALFEINIETFVSPSEIVISCIENVLLVSTTFFILFQITLLTKEIVEKFDKFKLLIVIVISIIAMILGATFDFLFKNLDNSLISYVITFVTTVILSWLIVNIVDSYLITETSENITNSTPVLLWLLKYFGGMILFAFVLGLADSTKILFGKSKRVDLEFTLISHKKIKTDYDLILIRKTQDYIFLYQRQAGETLMFPVKNILEIKQKNRLVSFFTK